MKHIKKKTVNDSELVEEFEELKRRPLLKNSKMPKLGKNYDARIITNDGKTCQAFHYLNNNKNCFIPIVHPVLVYYNKAYHSYKEITLLKETLLQKLHDKEILNETLLRLMYDLFGATSTYITLLFTSLEAFINQFIPENYIAEINENDKFTKTYNNMQIQRWLTFEQKVKNCLNKISGKDFVKKDKKGYQHIENLKKFRDSIMHTKKIESFEEYKKLYILSLDFKYEETLIACKDFINYYEPNLIEECPCKETY